MINRLVLDIETIPLLASLNAAYPADDRQPPANYKSDEAIAKWRAIDAKKWEDERVKECSLNPRLGRVLCIGMAGTDTKQSFVVGADTEAQEVTALRVFWDKARSYGGHVVTWNGSWDLQFILLRSIALGVEPTLSPTIIRSWFRKYSVEPHFDCKAVLTQWAPPKAGEGLSQWAAFLGVEGKTDGMTGADVYQMYVDQKLVEINKYCEQDVRTTMAIYDKMVGYFCDEPLYQDESYVDVVEEQEPYPRGYDDL